MLTILQQSINLEVKNQLLRMSPATIDRLLVEERKGKGKSTTKKSQYLFKSRIPIQADDSHIKESGFITSDTVVHCGDSGLISRYFSRDVLIIYSGVYKGLEGNSTNSFSHKK